MKIPKRFKLFGQTIEVKFDPDLLDQHDWQGAASYRRGEIRLLPYSECTPRKQEQIEATFCHELTHFLLYAANIKIDDKWLHQDEVVTELIGSLLHQALTTMEYE